MTLPGRSLTAQDLATLAQCGISPELAAQAKIRRVDSVEGAQIVGRRNGSGDYSGLVFPYYWPGDRHPREFRLRRDHPEIEFDRDGKPKPRAKYLSPPGRGNLLYFVPGTLPEWLQDPTMPVVMTEGEKKCLVLWRLAWEKAGDASERPVFLPVGLPGVWNWRGNRGKTVGPDGSRVNVKGPIPDLDRITWQDRKVTVAFDSNVRDNPHVAAARRALTEELRRRGARVHWLTWPEDTPAEVNGVDDLVVAWGMERVADLLDRAPLAPARGERPASPVSPVTVSSPSGDWRALLVRNARGAIRPILANAVTALRHAPEWCGVLRWDEFHARIVTARPTPWGGQPGEVWTDQDDRLLTVWLQQAGISCPLEIAGQAAQTVASEHPFHPVRDYLRSLRWDGRPRLRQWLTTYLGAPANAYTEAVGQCFMVGAVARILKPGCKQDTILVLEGPQGIGKSSAIRILFDPWYCDHLPELGSKDSFLQLHGSWCIELAELDALNRAEVSRIKAFLSSQVDKFRLPYGRRPVERPRQTVFVGTTNRDDWNRDETGARRYWPIRCGGIDLDALARDRDQLWAEAVALYDAGAKWWLSGADSAVIEQAVEEQAARYDSDPWEPLIASWVESPRPRLSGDGTLPPMVSTKEMVTLDDLLWHCLGKPPETWSQGDKNRVARCLRAMGWQRVQIRVDARRQWFYRRPS